MTFEIFKRRWLDKNGEPEMGKQTYLTSVDTIEEAKDYCSKWNLQRTDDEYKTMTKAEFGKK